MTPDVRRAIDAALGRSGTTGDDAGGDEAPTPQADDSALEAASQEFLDALKTRDPVAVASAFRTVFDALDVDEPPDDGR